MREIIIEATMESLKSIRQERFYRTERGYHGRFYCSLQQALDRAGILTEDLILEMEVQKSPTRHQTSQRPDIVLHIPVEHSGGQVDENNFAAWALKHHRKRSEATDDFDKLDFMFQHLKYPLGFFIVVDSDQHMLETYTGKYRDRILSFAVKLHQETILIRQAYFQDNQIVVTDTTT